MASLIFPIPLSTPLILDYVEASPRYHIMSSVNCQDVLLKDRNFHRKHNFNIIINASQQYQKFHSVIF